MAASRPEVIADTTSALERHMSFFSDNCITYDSLKKHLMELHIPEAEAASQANTLSFGGGLKVKWCPYRMFQAKEAVGVLNHARDTSIFKLDGTLDEARWEKLRSYAENINGTEIITEIKLHEFVKWCQDNDTRWDTFGIGKSLSDSEWSIFFNMCTDVWKGSERAVKLATLRAFYENSPAIFDKVVKGELPVPRPGL